MAIHSCITEAARVAESRFPGDLDYNSFFLDDGVVAGWSPAVQQIVSTLEERLLEIGLSIARHKPVVVPACTSVQNFSPHDFEGCAWVPDGNIKLLGAAIGSQSWCEALLKRRVVKARNLLDAIGRYPDAQGAFALLRSCSGWAKVLYSCRTVPPPLQAEGLSQADQDTRHSLGRLVGSPLSDDDWRVASIGVANGGLGARSALEHAPASPAWLRLRSSALESGQVSMNTTWTAASCVLMSSPLLGLLFFPTQVFATLLVPRPRRVCLLKLRPRFVITCLILRLTNATGQRTSASIAALEPERGFLPFLIPSNPTSRPLFRVSLRRRLHMLIWNENANCTLCGQVMNKCGDHALVCGCGGDRATRHKLVRDVVHPPTTGPALARSSRSLGSSSLVTPRTMTVPLAPTLWIPPLLLVAWLASRSPGAPVAVKRPGISQSPVLCALVRLRPIPRLFRESSPMLSLARRPF